MEGPDQAATPRQASQRVETPKSPLEPVVPLPVNGSSAGAMVRLFASFCLACTCLQVDVTLDKHTVAVARAAVLECKGCDSAPVDEARIAADCIRAAGTCAAQRVATKRRVLRKP